MDEATQDFIADINAAVSQGRSINASAADELLAINAELRTHLDAAHEHADAMSAVAAKLTARAEQAEAALAALQTAVATVRADLVRNGVPRAVTAGSDAELILALGEAVTKVIPLETARMLNEQRAHFSARLADTEAALAQLQANYATIPLDDLRQIANESQLASWSSVRYLRDWLASLEA